MKTKEEQAAEFALNKMEINHITYNDARDSFIAGAEWYKEQDDWKPISELKNICAFIVLINNMDYNNAAYCYSQSPYAINNYSNYTHFKIID